MKTKLTSLTRRAFSFVAMLGAVLAITAHAQAQEVRRDSVALEFQPWNSGWVAVNQNAFPVKVTVRALVHNGRNGFAELKTTTLTLGRTSGMVTSIWHLCASDFGFRGVGDFVTDPVVLTVAYDPFAVRSNY